MAPVRSAGRVALGLVLVAGAASGQPRDPRLASYLEAVEAYQRGEVDRAGDALAGWAAGDLKRAVARLAEDRRVWLKKLTESGESDKPERVPAEAAAMLHTEIFLVVAQRAGVGHEMASLHADLAGLLVRSLALDERDTRGLPPGRLAALGAILEGIARFQEHWYSLVVSVSLSQTNPEAASTVIDRGLSHLKDSARLQMLAGVTEEARARMFNGNLHDRLVVSGMRVSQARARLVEAQKHYRRAANRDPRLFEARLRLGRVLYLRNQPREARRELDAVARDSGDGRLLYLAHLFRGALNEYDDDLEAARQEYEAALALGPDYQTPYLALSYVEHLTGRGDRARELLALLTDIVEPAEDDPWRAYQNGARDDEALAWLRGWVSP
jgi:tetratricopeptide (TPR) repeat protein